MDENLFQDLASDRKPESLASRMDRLMEELAHAYCGVRVTETANLQKLEEEEEEMLEELRMQMEEHEESNQSGEFY